MGKKAKKEFISENEEKWKEIDFKARQHELMLKELARQRDIKGEKISKMTEEELLEYYHQIEKENDEFLKELGLSREKLTKKE